MLSERCVLPGLSLLAGKNRQRHGWRASRFELMRTVKVQLPSMSRPVKELQASALSLEKPR